MHENVCVSGSSPGVLFLDNLCGGAVAPAGCVRHHEPFLLQTEFTEAKRCRHRTLEAFSVGEPLFSRSCFTHALISLIGMHTKGSGREI